MTSGSSTCHPRHDLFFENSKFRASVTSLVHWQTLFFAELHEWLTMVTAELGGYIMRRHTSIGIVVGLIITGYVLLEDYQLTASSADSKECNAKIEATRLVFSPPT